MIAAIWGRAQAWLAASGVVFGIVVGAFLYGSANGRRDAAATQEKASAAARKQSKEVENEINGLDDRGVSDSLAKWMRDGKR